MHCFAPPVTRMKFSVTFTSVEYAYRILILKGLDFAFPEDEVTCLC